MSAQKVTSLLMTTSKFVQNKDICEIKFASKKRGLKHPETLRRRRQRRSRCACSARWLVTVDPHASGNHQVKLSWMRSANKPPCQSGQLVVKHALFHAKCSYTRTAARLTPWLHFVSKRFQAPKAGKCHFNLSICHFSLCLAYTQESGVVLFRFSVVAKLETCHDSPHMTHIHAKLQNETASIIHA